MEVADQAKLPFVGDYISAAVAGPSVLVVWTDLRDVVRGVDVRERGKPDDDDGFDVFLPCAWEPRSITAKQYRHPVSYEPCLDLGGLDENVYLARLPGYTPR